MLSEWAELILPPLPITTTLANCCEIMHAVEAVWCSPLGVRSFSLNKRLSENACDNPLLSAMTGKQARERRERVCNNNYTAFLQRKCKVCLLKSSSLLTLTKMADRKSMEFRWENRNTKETTSKHVNKHIILALSWCLRDGTVSLSRRPWEE